MTTTSNDDEATCCSFQAKTLKGKGHLIENVPLNESVPDFYRRIGDIEDTKEGKWKMMVIVNGSLRTLKKQDKDKVLRDYGTLPNEVYRIEVVLDMGACHSTCKR
mmetsp:Transcript_51298/g.76637  ORF Transcript_51298/g.76637 Transcript_51298/m.76637 type:complete len:105 (-) Transcript_51298:27-341(-)